MTRRLRAGQCVIVSACFLLACQTKVEVQKGSTLLLFSRLVEDRHQVFVIDVKTKHEIRLSEGAGDDTGPAWSPDRSRIAFSRREVVSADPLVEKRSILLMASDGSRVRNLIDDAGGMAWSPKGDAIAFIRGEDLWLANEKGNNQRLLLRSAFAADWSPDGRQIVVVRGEPPETELWRINADGVGLTSFKGTTGGTSPDWGPNGQIAFALNRNDETTSEIWTLDISTGKTAPLVKGDSWGALDPSWSHDGQELAFGRIQEDPSAEVDIGLIEQIWLRRRSGELVQITHGPDAFPYW